MSADSDRLDELAGSVLDGKPVDWAGAESSAVDEDEHLRVAALQEVSRIAEFNRHEFSRPTSWLARSTTLSVQAPEAASPANVSATV